MTGHFKKGQRGSAQGDERSSHRGIEGRKPKSATACWWKTFKAGELVDVTGVSKGKGFAGGVKRWHYAGGDATHGSMFHRAPGGIGGSSFPSRVWKNMHFPGHMGNAQVTAKNLKVIKGGYRREPASGSRFGPRAERLVHLHPQSQKGKEGREVVWVLTDY